MDSLNENRVLLVGLPGAGKTSFIAALWHVVNAEDVDGALRLSSLSGDDGYLNEITEAWITYEAVLRTTQQDEKFPTMRLESRASGDRCELTVPDLSGETYRRQWVDREWSESFDKDVRTCGALLVFIHPGQTMEAPEITPTMRMIPAALRQEVDAEPAEVVAWDAEKAAGIVQLVDVLQFIQRVARRPIRAAVFISAWDLVEDLFTNPNDYVAQRLPLLKQFLDTNHESFLSEVFGLSATGVALEDKDKTRQLQELVKVASERIKLVHGEEFSHDITIPLKWALGWELREPSAT